MDQQPSPTPKPKKKSKLLKWGVGVLAVFVFIGIVGSLIGNDNSNQPAATVTPPTVNQQQGTVKGEATEAVENVNVVNTEVKEVDSAPVNTAAIQPAPAPKSKSVVQPEPTPTPVVNIVNTAPAPAPDPVIETNTTQKTCCKVCSKGKACGDSCISRTYNCTKAPGCACDAN